MVLWEKALATRPDDLGLILETHEVEGKNRLLHVLWFPRAECSKCVCVHAQ